MKGKVDILANFPIDTSLKKKTHSAMNHLFSVPVKLLVLQNLIGECCSLEGIEDPLKKKYAVNGGSSKYYLP